MKSAIRLARKKLRDAPPVALARQGTGFSSNVFNLGAGRQDRETLLRTYGRSGTVFSIISLLAQSTSSITWHLYKKEQQDARRRYSTSDQGSDNRIEVIQHAALQLWNAPNDWHSNFEFQEGANQHLELTGETFWVVDRESTTFPTAMWYIGPERMVPVPGTDRFLAGWVYLGPNGEQVPLDVDDVILEKTPDPMDPFRGAGPVSSIMPNIDQQRYATEYQRNLFLNGAHPDGLITIDNKLTDREWDELTSRWRESHLGIARAGRVGVLENGASWTDSTKSNRDMEYKDLRLANRDEIREAWRIHKTMMGTADDVNRANAQTAEEVFVAWQALPRLERRRNTLNFKLLPMFGSSAQGVEFDFEDPSPVNAETASAELLAKANAAEKLIQAGYEPHAVLEVVGLPDMDVAEVATQAPALPPSWVQEQAPPPPDSTQSAAAPAASPEGRQSYTLRAGPDAATLAYKQALTDYPAHAIAWMLHASWAGPVKVPESHIDPDMAAFDAADPTHVDDFTQLIQSGKKLSPVILVKRPGKPLLLLADGHHRYLAALAEGKKVRAFVGTVNSDHGPWETMHSSQVSNKAETAPSGLSEFLAGSLASSGANGHVNGNAPDWGI